MQAILGTPLSFPARRPLPPSPYLNECQVTVHRRIQPIDIDRMQHVQMYMYVCTDLGSIRRQSWHISICSRQCF